MKERKRRVSRVEVVFPLIDAMLLARHSAVRSHCVRGAVSSSVRHASSTSSQVYSQRFTNFMLPTVWHEFTPLAVASGAVNLGQGFPGWAPPQFAREALAEASASADEQFLVHQYARPDGNLDLVAELAKKYSPSLGRQLDPVTEIVVANGASGVLSNLLAGLLNPGDEVVTIEPSFDLYAAGVETAGGVMKSVALRPDAATQKWQLDFDELEAAFTDRTRALLLNTPQNPTGKVFNRAELERIADIVKRHPGVVVMSDEVYEHMVFDDNAHIPIASLDGMWDRTVTISSAGKTFSCTGWKVGWAIGPAELVRACGVVQSWTCFSGNNPAQLAVAKSMQLASASGYYEELNEMYAKNRDTMCDVLHSVGIKPMVPEGAFFVMGDFSGLDISDEMLRDATPEDRWQDLNRDWKLSRWLTQNVGVAVIPPSAFMKKENWPLVENYVRFAFCKPERDILEARDRLLKAGIQRK